MKRGGEDVGEPAPSSFVQAARRIDWRFLLPDPQLGRTACVGRVDRGVIDSLQLFATSVTIVDAAATDAGAHDLVVLADPSRGELGWAADLLRPGGWVYVELSRASSRRVRGRLGSPKAVAAALARGGFDQVEAHWHFPDAARREALVALDDERAVQQVLTRLPRTLNGAAREAGGRLLLATHLFGVVVRSTSVIGRRLDASVAEGA